MLWSCCGLGRRRNRRDSEEPDETTRLLTTSDALFPQIHEAPRPPDDEALLEYRKRIDRILEETAEKLISVSVNNTSNTSHHQHGHHHHNRAFRQGRSGSSSTASTSTAKASKTSTSTTDRGGGDAVGNDTAGRDTLWRAEGAQGGTATKGSVYSMKKVSSKAKTTSTAKQSTKAKGKQVAREIAGLPNGHAADDHDVDNDDDETQDHGRDGTMASYRTANEVDEADADSNATTSEGSDDESGDDEESASEVSSSDVRSQEQGRERGHDRSKRPRPVQDIFQSDTLTKIKPQERLEKALTMSDDDFARQLTQ